LPARSNIFIGLLLKELPAAGNRGEQFLIALIWENLYVTGKRYCMSRPKINKFRKNEAIAGYLFILPIAIGLGIFSYYAFVKNLYDSFTYSSMMMPAEFVGLGNYKDLLLDKEFLQAFGNTLVYVVGCVPPILIIALLLAVLLNTGIRCKGIFRTLIFFPLVTTPAAIAMTWRWIFNTRFGIINVTLESIGLNPVPWLTGENITQFSCIIVIIWAAVGYQVIVLLAGLQGIPKVYYEAACIDGASPVKQFFSVTLPLLSPTIYFVLTLLIVTMFKEFEIVYMLIPSGEYNTITPAIASSRSMVRYFYDTAFRGEYRQGYAAAITIYLFVAILVVTLIQNHFQKKWVFYDE
jgi:multiple sugar transport system permease protein